MAGKGQTVPSNKIGTLGNYGRSHCQAAYLLFQHNSQKIK